MHVYPHVRFKNGGRITTGFSAKHKAKDISPRDDDDGQVFAVGSGTVTTRKATCHMGTTTRTVLSFVDRISSSPSTHTSPPSVSTSDVVTTGDKIRDVDLSGDSTGRHVHLARLPGDGGSVQDVIDAQDKAVFFEFKTLKPW
jgi:hypothetical protein